MKYLVYFAGLLLASSLVLAEGHRGGDAQGQQRAQRMQRMQEHLQLSDTQVAEIRSIRENGGSREDVRAVLTDEQRTLMKEHRAKRGEKKHGQRPPPPVEGSDG